jgi:hypothetical protein
MNDLLRITEPGDASPAVPAEASPRELLEFAFERATHEQDELSDRWKLLDAKAQATAGIAGIFVAAAFAFARTAGPPPAGWEKWLLAALLVSLAVAIGFAVGSMLVRSVALPPTAEDAARMVGDAIARPPQEYERRYTGLLADSVDKWVGVLRDSHRAVNAKAGRLAVSQYALLASVALALVLTLAVLQH